MKKLLRLSIIVVFLLSACTPKQYTLGLVSGETVSVSCTTFVQVNHDKYIEVRCNGNAYMVTWFERDN